jgi:ATP-dependent DNA helicase RecQ
MIGEHEFMTESPRPVRAPLEVLRDVYGHAQFRGQQHAIIEHVIAGGDALVLMPTGGGKSVCYQIPALVLPGMAIVVSPLIALMRDQVRALAELGVAAAYLNSTLEPREQAAVLAAAQRGELDLLYVAPERLLREATLEALATGPVSLIAIDEAHCVSAWGHDFRQDYLELGILRQTFRGVPRIALTATADERTRADIVARQDLAEPTIFIDGFDRPNICYSVRPKAEPRAQLLQFIAERRDQAGIVYCLSRRAVDETARWLCDQGFDALPYHAGLEAETRHRHQERFLTDDAVIVVATIAFGMGIDKPDVRFVAHLDLPKSLEAYYQETGRAGRDGAPADAWMVYGLQDVVRLSRMVAESPASEEHKRIERAKLDALLGWCEVTSCRRRELLRYFGEELVRDCGNCDICLAPPRTWDGTEAAQKALSCVYRTGQRFGAGHVIDVLRGQRRERVVRLHHDQLSTFGVGEDLSEAQWRSVFRQLVVRGHLAVDHGAFGALRLTGSSRALLRGDERLALREDAAVPKARRARGSTAAPVDPADQPLMDSLKTLRRELAAQQGVPPYVVFHDSTLAAMIDRRPTSTAELLDLPGVGRAKLERYGDRFLALLAEHTAASP